MDRRAGHGLARRGATPRTAEYSDLTFAYGLARLGERDACMMLVQRAKAVLGDEDDAHQLLFNGFECRIRQALDGQPAGGPLPAELMEYLELLRKNRRQEDVPGLGYVVDGLRKASRVLEPDQRIDPTLFVFRTDEVRAELAAVLGLTDRKEIVDRVHALLRKTPKGIADFRAAARS